jgi:hypothetical protein
MDSFGNLPEAFGHWSFASENSGTNLSFAQQGEQSAPKVSLWRMDLPPDAQAATDQLAHVETQIADTQASLQVIPERIEDLIAGLQDSGPVSFEVAAEPLPDPERELLRWLDSAEPGGISFGTETIPPDEVNTAGQGFRQATQNLMRALTHLAWIETQQAGQLFARTTVSWTGDQNTAWEHNVTPQQFTLHQQSVRLAITSRLALLRLLIVVTQGATKLSILIATPGAALLALPAAWKFANNVMAEANNIRAI